MNLKEEILKNSGVLSEGIRVSDTKIELWKGEPVKKNLYLTLNRSKCFACGEPLPYDGEEIRFHELDIVGFRGKNYHKECFVVPKDAKEDEKLSFATGDEPGFLVASISDDWQSAYKWSMEDED